MKRRGGRNRQDAEDATDLGGADPDPSHPWGRDVSAVLPFRETEGGREMKRLGADPDPSHPWRRGVLAVLPLRETERR